MKVIDYLKIGREFLKKMSNLDLRRDDYLHIELYEEYMRMRYDGDKVDYILHVLADRHKLSESTVKRIIRRFSQEVK